MRKICFVVMGFGKKMDYENSKEVNFDIFYRKVIKELFNTELTDYELIRADDIQGSSIIDIAMYTLLMKADLVLANITTLNPNAIYELGVRHALKPYSTIIMAENTCKLPFDLNHSRCLLYNEIGENLEDEEAEIIRGQLKSYINASENKETDSPLYTYLPHISPPAITEEEYSRIIDAAKGESERISDLVRDAENFRNRSQFDSAIILWRKLSELLPNNDYIVQQLALCTYKSKIPNATMALESSRDIINKLDPRNSLDIETLGITGAIFKRLYRLNNNFDYLEEAIFFYRKGYIIQNDYYNGENYANCLLLKTQNKDLTSEDIAFLKYENKKLRQEVIEVVNRKMSSGEVNIWMYATLAICYLCLGDNDNFERFQSEFQKLCSVDWEKKTFLETVSEIKVLI